jgi:hypothetical protein
MSSLRKRYRAEDREAPPVSTAPTSLGGVADTTPTPQDTPAQEAAPKLEEHTPPPSGTEASPAEAAGKDSLKARLAEMEKAIAIEREQPPRFAREPQQSPTTEDIISATELPETAKDWLRRHPSYITDPAKNRHIIELHSVAARQAGSEWDDRYFERMEDLLGMTPSRGTQQPAPRNAAPVRQQYKGPTLSAPPHREVPSMTTGRVSEPTRLTGEELQLAKTLGLTQEQYRQGKERMLRLKQAGVIPDGR